MHPKVDALVKVLLEHFNRFQQAQQAQAGGSVGSSSEDAGKVNEGNDGGGRVIVFSQFRDSVQEIVKQLRLHEPIIKAHFFIGQAGSKGRQSKAAAAAAARAGPNQGNHARSPQVARGQNQKEQKMVCCAILSTPGFSSTFGGMLGAGTDMRVFVE